VFFVLNLLLFAVLFVRHPDHVWTARVFYVWLSVFNLFVVSVAWSVMADCFRVAQAHRLFALIAAGASAGGLVGPALGALLVEPLGHGGLMVVSALLLLPTVPAPLSFGWRERAGAMASGTRAACESPARPPVATVAGLLLVLRSPDLLGVSAFVLLLATTTTFLFFEQARMVEAAFPDSTRQTQIFGVLDFAVQALTITLQLLVTGRIAERFGSPRC
jgi:AAA family ATP:ADP antiporter